MKISFCTTCKNRLYQLEKTLPENLKAARGNVEFVLVNYGSEDGLDAYIWQHFEDVIDKEILRYVDAKDMGGFHASIAKNLAHRAATGDILFNLDADNFVGLAAEDLRALIDAPNSIVHGWSGTYFDGTFGRIGMRKDAFLALGGYDESFLPVGYQDADLLARAQAMHMPYLHKPSGAAIANSKHDTIKYTDVKLTYPEMNEGNKKRSLENVKTGRLKANQEGFASVTISINRGPEIVL